MWVRCLTRVKSTIFLYIPELHFHMHLVSSVRACCSFPPLYRHTRASLLLMGPKTLEFSYWLGVKVIANEKTAYCVLICLLCYVVYIMQNLKMSSHRAMELTVFSWIITKNGWNRMVVMVQSLTAKMKYSTNYTFSIQCFSCRDRPSEIGSHRAMGCDKCIKYCLWHCKSWPPDRRLHAWKLPSAPFQNCAFKLAF